MTEKKRPVKRGDVQTEEARKNEMRTEERIDEDNSPGLQDESRKTDQQRGSDGDDARSRVGGGGEESKDGRKQKGNSKAG